MPGPLILRWAAAALFVAFAIFYTFGVHFFGMSERGGNDYIRFHRTLRMAEICAVAAVTCLLLGLAVVGFALWR